MKNGLLISTMVVSGCYLSLFGCQLHQAPRGETAHVQRAETNLIAHPGCQDPTYYQAPIIPGVASAECYEAINRLLQDVCSTGQYTEDLFSFAAEKLSTVTSRRPSSCSVPRSTSWGGPSGG